MAERGEGETYYVRVHPAIVRDWIAILSNIPQPIQDIAQRIVKASNLEPEVIEPTSLDTLMSDVIRSIKTIVRTAVKTVNATTLSEARRLNSAIVYLIDQIVKIKKANCRELTSRTIDMFIGIAKIGEERGERGRR